MKFNLIILLGPLTQTPDSDITPLSCTLIPIKPHISLNVFLLCFSNDAIHGHDPKNSLHFKLFSEYSIHVLVTHPEDTASPAATQVVAYLMSCNFHTTGHGGGVCVMSPHHCFQILLFLLSQPPPPTLYLMLWQF